MNPSERRFINIQTIFWPAFFVVAIFLIWLLKEVIAPFLTGLAIAYLLNPVVTSLSRRIPRSMSALFVLVGFAVLVGTIITLLSPVLGRQAAEFFSNLPQYMTHFQTWAKPYVDKTMARLQLNGLDPLSSLSDNSVSTILAGTKSVIPSLWVGGLALIGIGTFLIITPIVAFYCMRDWPRLTHYVDSLLPRGHSRTIRSILREFDMRLAGFVRGQVLVCVCVGVIYATALSIVGLKYGLAIGAIAGLLSFIPFVGSTFGFVASVGVALVQFNGMQMPLIVVAIFIVGQLIEGNFLTPRLVGSRTGLHPVWVIFALMAGGALFGFTGLLLAVPVAALIGVLVRHAVDWYQHSETYLGEHSS